MSDAAQPSCQDERPQPAAPALREGDEGAVRFANRLHELIALAPDLTLRRGCHRRRAQGAETVFCDPAGFVWQLLVPGASEAQDLDAQMALLAAHEDVLQTLECALGIGFSPTRTVRDWDGRTAWVELAYKDRLFALGFLPAAMRPDILAQRDGEPQLARTPLRARLGFRAATLALEDVETLARGALLCLPAGSVKATLDIPQMGQKWSGFWSLEGHIFRQDNDQCEGEPAMAQASPDLPRAALKVPMTVRLPEAAIPAARIETLAEGGALELAPLSEGLEAELLVAGQIIAKGEIVRLGDTFAFLVDAMAAPHQPPAGAAASPQDAQPVTEMQCGSE